MTHNLPPPTAPPRPSSPPPEKGEDERVSLLTPPPPEKGKDERVPLRRTLVAVVLSGRSTQARMVQLQGYVHGGGRDTFPQQGRALDIWGGAVRGGEGTHYLGRPVGRRGGGGTQ